MAEERELVELALRCADSGSATHWPTAAGYLADEVRSLRAEVAKLKAEAVALQERHDLDQAAYRSVCIDRTTLREMNETLAVRLLKAGRKG
jgi:hypothetical protein